MGKTQYYNEVTIMKAIATLFITWFHFKFCAPESLQPLFIGGVIGNSLFFFCSGYLLKFKEEAFYGQWMMQKYMRVMIPVWIIYVMMICGNSLRGVDTHFAWQFWMYPTIFWFVNSILCYFLIVFIAQRWIDARKLDKGKQDRNLLLLGAMSLVINILWYVFFEDNKSAIIIDEGGYKSWFFLTFFLWGYYVRNYGDNVKASNLSWIEAPLSLAMFYGYKKLAADWMIEWQVIFVPILLAYVIYAYRRLAKTLLSYKLPDSVKTIIMFLASITLEIYIVQVYIIQWLSPLISFPFNIPVGFAIIIAIAYIVHIVATMITSRLDFLR